MLAPHSRLLLGRFIRSHREALTPLQPTTGRRRTPGWRREELADAACVSVTWLTWLEQGRDVAASAPALGRLAQALQLTPAERSSLFDLADKRDSRQTPAPLLDLPAALLQLPSQFTGPAYLLDRHWTARAWNAAAATLFNGWLSDEATERNVLRFMFGHPAATTLIPDWSDRASRLVAEFRADYSRTPDDPGLQQLIADLEAGSPEFAAYWKAHSVRHREGGTRHFNHPLQGAQDWLQTTLLVAAHPDCKLVCLSPISADCVPEQQEYQPKSPRIGS